MLLPVPFSSHQISNKALNLFLAKPMAVVPGTAMTCDSVPEARDRSDLIACLKAANNLPTCKPWTHDSRKTGRLLRNSVTTSLPVNHYIEFL